MAHLLGGPGRYDDEINPKAGLVVCFVLLVLVALMAMFGPELWNSWVDLDPATPEVSEQKLLESACDGIRAETGDDCLVPASPDSYESHRVEEEQELPLPATGHAAWAGISDFGKSVP